MLVKRTSVISACILFCLTLFISCTKPPSSITTPAPTRTIAITPTLSTTLTQTSTPVTTPTHYTSHVLLSGARRPDDLAFDSQGRLLFSDFYHGTVSRLNVNGSVTIIVSGLAGPEGMVFLSDGTMIIAEQRTNRILTLAPGAKALTVLRALPGRPS